MENLPISKKLAKYQPENPQEAEDLVKIRQLIADQALRSFDRDNYAPGHVTGSAWILSRDHQKALMTDHVKLAKWMQLGGHSDSDPDTMGVALREGQEESGLKSIRAINDEIFDIDIHRIVPHKDTPEHYHYDICFLFEADDNEPFNRQEEESRNLHWVPLADMPKFNNEDRFQRMVRKTKRLYP